MYDVVSLISAIVGSGVIGSIISYFIFKKQNKKLKDNEVKSSDEDVTSKKLENDGKQMDLGDRYLSKIIEVADIIDENNVKNDKHWETLHNDISLVKNQVGEIIVEQKLQGEFLNGEFAEFKKHKKRKNSNKK